MGKFRKNEIPGIRKEIHKEETFSKYGESSREVEIGPIKKHGAFRGVPFSGIPDVDLWSKGICL